jgi:hypothetical protein
MLKKPKTDQIISLRNQPLIILHIKHIISQDRLLNSSLISETPKRFPLKITYSKANIIKKEHNRRSSQ